MRREAHPGVLDLSSSDPRDGLAHDDHPSIGLSDEGSLLLRDLRLNALGGLTGIALGDLNLGPELGRGASSVVFLATYRCGGWNRDKLSAQDFDLSCVSIPPTS